MQLYRILFILLLYASTSSAGDKIMWQRFVNDTTRQVGNSLWFVVSKTIDQDQNIYLTALYYQGDSSVPILHKYSKNGVPIWKKILLPLNDNNRYVAQSRKGKMYIDIDGNLVNLFCYSDTTADSNGKRYSKLLMTKLDLNGQIITSKVEDLNYYDSKLINFHQARVLPNGDFYLGISNDDALQSCFLLTLQYDKNFNKIYEYSFDTKSIGAEYNGSFSFINKDSLLFIAFGGTTSNFYIKCINMNTNQEIWNNYFSLFAVYNSVFQLEEMNGYIYLVSFKIFKFSEQNGALLDESNNSELPIFCEFDKLTNKIYARNNASKDITIYNGDNLNILVNKTFSYRIYNLEKVSDTLYAVGVESDTINIDNWRLLKIYKLDTLLNTIDSFSFTYPPLIQTIYISHLEQPDLIIDDDRNFILISQLISYKINNLIACPLLIHKICFNCSENFSGRVYIDNNQNCIFDSSDYVVAGNLIKLQPDNDYAITDNQGYYYFFNTSNSVNIECIPFINGMPFCNGISTISANQSNVTVDSINFGYNLGEFQHKDIEAQILAGIARPGFNQFCTAIFSNHSAEPLFNSKVSITIDNNFSFVSSSVLYDSVIGKTYYFTIDTLQINAAKQINLILNVDVNLVTLGDAFLHSTQAFLANDANVLNNIDTTNGIIVGSYDPNYIAVSPIGITKDHLIENRTTLNYYVEFQNTGSDTAFNVKVVVPIDGELDLTTFRFNGSTHTCRTQIENNTLTFVYDNILLVDSNKSYESSIGFFNYSIATKECKDGTRIDAFASIYFDYNKPIITNSVFNTIGRPGSLFTPDDKDDFNLFPNPGKTNEFKLVVNLVSSKYNISILDLTGRKIAYDNTSYLHNGKYYHTIRIKENAEGIYLIQMQTPQKVITRKWLYAKE